MKRLLFLTFVLMWSCTSYPPLQIPGIKNYSDAEYSKIFSKYTETAKRYDGITNTMVVKATVLTEDLALAYLARNAQIHQWDQSKYESEKAELMAELSRKTHVFLSLYTPGSRLDDLLRKKKAWTLLLETQGQRYEGDVEKIDGQIEELKPIFPTHDRFSRAYWVSFPLSSQNLQSDLSFIITGPVDSATLSFDRL